MWHSVGFLLFLLFFSSPAHDVKKFQFVEDDLHNTSAQYYGQVSSCYRKGNPEKCNSFTVRSEIQRLRQIRPTHSNRAASGGLLSPSSSFSGNGILSSSTNLTSDNLVPSTIASSSVVESPSIFSKKLQLKRQNLLFSLPFVHTPRRYLLAAPSLPVEPSTNPHTPSHIFPRPAMDDIRPSFSVPTHYGQPQYLSHSGSYENQRFIRILSSSSGLPSIIYSPTIFDGKPALGSYTNKIQHLKAAPPLLPYIPSPLVSPQNLKHWMHQSAFHPVMPNPANLSVKWLSPSLFGAPSEVRPPVADSWISATPSGIVSFPPTISPSEQTVGNISMPVKAPSIIFPSGSHNKGPVASAPSTYALGRSQNQPSMPGTALPRNRAKKQAPVAMPPMSFSSPPNPFPSESPMEKPKAPEVVPFIKFSPLGNKHDLKEPSVSPITSPAESPWKNARIPATSPVHKSSSRHAPASGQGSVSSPQISLTFEPPWGNAASPAFVPSLKGIGYPPPIDLPSEPQEVPPPILSPSHGHYQNMQGPAASSPSVFPFKAPMKKPTLPHLELPRNRSKRQAPVTLAPRNQGHVAAPNSVPYEPHTEYRVAPKLAPSITLHSPPYHQDLRGPSISPSNPSQMKPRIPVADQPWKSSRHAPVTIVPVIQGPVSFPPIAPPHEQPIGNCRNSFMPSIIIPSPSPYSGVKGHVTSPSNNHYRSPLKKPRIFLAPSPLIRSHWHAPTVIPPIDQGHFYTRPTLPPEQHKGNDGPTASPLIIASQPPQKLRNITRALPSNKRPWRHAPLAIPSVHEGSIPSQFTVPSGPPKVISRAPASVPQIIVPTPHNWVVKGPVTYSPSIIPSRAAQRKPSIPVAAPPSIRLRDHAPVTSLPIFQGPISSPVKSLHPSSSANLRTPTLSPSIISPFSTHHRLQKPAPVGSPLMNQGPIHSRVRFPHPSSPGNLRTPTVSPSIIFPSHNQSWKHAPVATPPVIQGSIYYPVESPHPSSSGNFRTPTVSPSIIFPSPPHNQSRKHAPVASPHIIQGPADSPVKSPHPSPPHHLSQNHTTVGSSPVIQGPVYPPEKSPYLPSSGNLRTPTASPPIAIPSAPYHRSQKHATVASPPTSKGLIDSPAKSPHPSTPNQQSQNHTRVGSLPPIQGPVYSPENPPDQPSSGMLRTPTASRSVVIPSPPHHQSWKQAPFASPPMSKGLINSPAKSPFPSTPHHRLQNHTPVGSPVVIHRSQKLTPVGSPVVIHRSQKHTPVGSPPVMQGPVYSPEKSPIPPSSGNLRTPTGSPTIVIPSPPHHRSRKHAPVASPPTSKGLINSPAKSPHPSPLHHRSQKHTSVGSPSMIQGPVYSPEKSQYPPSSGNLRTPTASPSIAITSTPHHHSRKHAPVSSPAMSKGLINSPAKSPHPSPSGNLRIPAASPSNKFPLSPHQGHTKGTYESPHSSPLHHRSQKHTPVGSPSMIQGHVYSPEKSQYPPSSGNLRTPTASPSIAITSPPHHHSRKHAPVSSPAMSKGLINSPAKSPHSSPSGNFRIPAASPSNKFPSSPHQGHTKGTYESPHSSPLHHRSQKHTPVGSPSMIQGPVYSPEKSQYPPSSGNLRTPTASPSIAITSPPHHHSRKHAPVSSPAMSKGLIDSPAKSPHPSPSGNFRIPAASPSNKFPSSPHQGHTKGTYESPHSSPLHHRSQKHTSVGSPSMIQGPVYSPEKSQYPPSSGNSRTPTASPSIAIPSPPHHHSRKHAPVSSPAMSKGLINSPAKSPHPSPSGNLRIPAASPSNKFPLSPHQGHTKGSLASPDISPSEPSKKTPTPPVAPPPMLFPPPPPGLDCNSVICTVPFTSTPPGSPCGCVYPMQIELGLGVALYAFFPLVSELASQIAAGTFLKQSQVRIMGANADSQDQEKTIVDIDLVPLGENFDNTTAFLIFDRFWQKKVTINETLFGDYWVILIQYPGLPQSPPSAFPNTTYNGMPNSNSIGPSKRDPLGVDVNKQNDKMGAGTIVVVALSSAIAMIICLGTVWIIMLKCRNQNRPTSAVVEPTHVPSSTKRSATGGGSILSGSMASSTSMSFASSMVTYTGSAKTFTSAELEKATDRFNPQYILGEGGFGRVYRGLLEDGTKVAVKVLTRDDQQGGREFIAEVEMLSRLHHRNLVKLIGICTEEHNRCLVYELIPNGSVESHLHGLDKETAPLDWDARIKIALGAARGLAYLHEDSSPRVIHRDFKASNILLEDDFTPKVSDFGLAKSASEEVSGHISTRVMGTFGYVAPEYAMTGHLLVKSDVYSYGVVLLELLSGRKPVDMSQPPGQENLVTWARPLLTSKEGLETLVDPALGGNLPFDNIARVAAIASMCVQPDHSHRPFMGEVVQALKLVYNDSDASNAGGSGSFSRGESSAHDTEVKDSSSQPWHHSMQYVPDSTSFVTIDYDSGPLETQGLEVERPLSASALVSNSGRLIRQLSGSFRRHSSSGPLRTNKSKESWYGIRGLERGSISEHGFKRHFDRGSDGDVQELWP